MIIQFKFPSDALHEAFENFEAYYTTKQIFDPKVASPSKQAFYNRMCSLSEYEEAIYIMRICLHLAWKEIMYEDRDFQNKIAKGKDGRRQMFSFWLCLPRDNESISVRTIEPCYRYLLKTKKSKKEKIAGQKAIRRLFESVESEFLEFIDWKYIFKTFFWQVSTGMKPITKESFEKGNWNAIEEFLDFLVIFADDLFLKFPKRLVARVVVERFTCGVICKEKWFHNEFDYQSYIQESKLTPKEHGELWEQATLELRNWVVKFNKFVEDIKPIKSQIEIITFAERQFAQTPS